MDACDRRRSTDHDGCRGSGEHGREAQERFVLCTDNAVDTSPQGSSRTHVGFGLAGCIPSEPSVVGPRERRDGAHVGDEVTSRVHQCNN
jgi:hypothetical protein